MRRSYMLFLLLAFVGCRRVDPPPAARSSEASASDLLAGTIVDLTHSFDERTIYWPTEKGFVFERGNNGVTAKGYYYAANRFHAPEHGGTHLDAPIHFFATGQAAEALDLKSLMGEAAVVDVADKCAANRDYLIGIDDLHAWEERRGRRLVDLIVLLRTGWSKHWPDRKTYLGTEAHGPEALAELHFPGLSPEAAKWLTTERKIKAIGIDTASIDYGQSTHFENHVTLCSKNVPIFENVAALERVPETGALVIALPMKIAGGSGGPLRIVAIVHEPSR